MSHEPEKAAMPVYDVDEKRALSSTDNEYHGEVFEADLEGEEPTEEELKTLRRVSGKIPWTAFTVAFVELCERFGYYGCQVLCKSNHVACLDPLLTLDRHQLHPEAPSRHRRRITDDRSQPHCRRQTWCVGYGPACFIWHRSIQLLLGLHDPHYRCHYRGRIPRSL